MSWLKRKSEDTSLPPTPGNWYVDKAGALFKVKALVYSSGELKQALVDYPRDASSWLIEINNWNQLIFEVDAPTPERTVR
jgi:hypothetical protein